jgi:hypothetical protein
MQKWLSNKLEELSKTNDMSEYLDGKIRTQETGSKSFILNSHLIRMKKVIHDPNFELSEFISSFSLKFHIHPFFMPIAN